MVSRFRYALSSYPRQFWVLFFGQLVSASGGSLVWPFMTIYVHERLGVPPTVVGSVLAANSVVGLLSQLVAGPGSGTDPERQPWPRLRLAGHGRHGTVVSSGLPVAGDEGRRCQSVSPLPSLEQAMPALLETVRPTMVKMIKIVYDCHGDEYT